MINVGEIKNTAPLQFKTELQKKVYNTLNALQIPYLRVDTDEAITMEDCLAIEKKLDMKMVKTLFLCNRRQTEFYLFITCGDKPFSSKNFSAALGISRVSFASEEQMQKILGVKIGAATVMSVLLESAADVHLVFDKNVIKEEFYGCSDGTTTGYMKLKTQDVINRILGCAGRRADIIEV